VKIFFFFLVLPNLHQQKAKKERENERKRESIIRQDLIDLSRRARLFVLELVAYDFITFGS